MKIPKFKTRMEKAQFGVYIKRFLRKKGVLFKNDWDIETLLELKEFVEENEK